LRTRKSKDARKASEKGESIEVPPHKDESSKPNCKHRGSPNAGSSYLLKLDKATLTSQGGRARGRAQQQFWLPRKGTGYSNDVKKKKSAGN